MNILFIGIYDRNEPNTALRNAFRKVSDNYVEIAWNLIQKNMLHETIALALNSLNNRVDLVFMQLQGPDIIKDATLKILKQTGAFLVQWTGDARQPLPNHYITFGRKIDLSLFTNIDDVLVMRKHGAKADYLQVAADHNIYNPVGETVNCPEIVFMGNNYGDDVFGKSKYRKEMVEFLQRTYGKRFGVYGSGWKNDAGNLMFQQEKEAAVYRSCKIAINCSHYDLKRYTSDRFFRIMLSGAFCLSKEFPEMEEFQPRVLFGVYDGSFSHLKESIDYYLNCAEVRVAMAKKACGYAQLAWTWDHRIQELLQLIEKYKK